MQTLTTYLRLNGVSGTPVDSGNQPNAQAPSITRGMAVTWKVGIFDDANAAAIRTQASQSGIATWKFAVGNDYNQATAPQIRITSGITVDASGFVCIPIANTNTTELAAAIGTSKSVSLHCELCGYAAGETTPTAVIQWEATITNRVDLEGGSPSAAVAENYLTSAQVSALVGSKLELQFSSDGTSWHDTQVSGDSCIRMRTTGVANASWSEAFEVPTGADGTDGEDGTDGTVVTIDATTKHWLLDGVDSGVLAEAQNNLTFADLTEEQRASLKGDTGATGPQGPAGTNGTNGTNGTDGVTPTVTIDATTKHWIINGTDTGVVAEGQDGEDGATGATGATGASGLTRSTVTDTSSTSITLATMAAATDYHYGTLTSLTINAVAAGDNESTAEFTSGATACTMTLPTDVLTDYVDQPQANKLYKLAILNKLAVGRNFTPAGSTPAPTTGTLTVTTTGASGQWSADNGTTWNNSGASATLSAGSYTVTFKPVSGYVTPSSQNVTVTAGQTTTATAEYVAEAQQGIPDSYNGNLSVTYNASYGNGQGTYTFAIVDASQTGTARAWYCAEAGEGGDWLVYREGRWEIGHDARGSSLAEALQDWGGPVTTQGYCETLDGTWSNGAVVAENQSCLVAGTLITLADHTQKAVEDITYDDELLVWDFDSGRFATARPAWIKREETTEVYYAATFGDGRRLEVVGPVTGAHRFFSIDTNRFEYVNRSAGHTAVTETGEELECVAVDVIRSEVKFYNLVTARHFNCFANGILTSNRFSNMYAIEDMKYIKEERTAGDWTKAFDAQAVADFRLDEMPEDMTEYVGRMLANKA